MPTGFKIQSSSNHSERMLANVLNLVNNERRSIIYPDYTQQIDHVIAQPYPYSTFKEYSNGHPYLRIVHGAASSAVLRTLPELGNWAKPRFIKKCTGCGREYQQPVTECKDCGPEALLRDPNPQEKQRLNNFFDNPNRDDETRDIFASLLKDHYSCDDWYFSVKPVVGNQYAMYAEDASEIYICADKHASLGNGVYFCSKCWDYQENDEIFNMDIGACPKCGGPLTETAYVQRKGNDSTITARFGRREIIHGNGDPWLPKRYGNSKVPAIMTNLRTAYAMDQNDFRTYSKGSVSKIIGLKGETQDVATNIAQSVHDKQEKLTRDPQTGQLSRERNMMLFLGTQQGMETADLMMSAEDMQTLQLKEWILVKIVGAVYGVQPIMINQSSSPTGYHERMSVSVDQESTRQTQRMFSAPIDEHLIKDVLGIQDWIFNWQEIEGRDELEEANIWLNKVRAGKEAVNAGLTAELTEEGELRIQGKFEKQEPLDMFGNPANKPDSDKQEETDKLPKEDQPEKPEAFNPTKTAKESWLVTKVKSD